MSSDADLRVSIDCASPFASTSHAVGKWHLGGTADGQGLPTRHGFDSYWGMPITNVQACRAGHQEYIHSSLWSFLIDRSPTNVILLALAVIALTPYALGFYARWTITTLLVCGASAGYIYWFTATLTLINPKSCLLYENETLIEQPVQLNHMTLRHTQRALRVIADAPRPFFLYLSYANAHTALFAMDEHRGLSAHGPYGDNVEEMDWSVGLVMAALAERNETSSTFVYFASDNGPFREELDEGGYCGHAPVLTPSTPLMGDAAATPARARVQLRGAKGQTWECGLRVPALIALPSRWPAGVAVHTATSAMDIMPTVLALIDSQLPQQRQAGGSPLRRRPPRLRHISELGVREMAGVGVLDGVSLVPLLDGQLAENGHRVREHEEGGMVHYCGANVSAVRQGRFKVHYTTTRWEDEEGMICRRAVICACHGHRHDPPLLYDVHADPAEAQPLDPTTPDHAEVLQRALATKQRHEATLVAVPSQTERLPTLGHFPCCGIERGTFAHVWSTINNLCGC